MSRIIPTLIHGGCLVSAFVITWTLSAAPGFADGDFARLEPVKLPSAAGSLAPRWLSGPADAAIGLSWLEPFGDGHRLRAALFTDGRFETPRDIAAGDDWFVNWADTPGVFVDGNGAWTAYWLQRSGTSAYAYDIRLARSRDLGGHWQPLPSPHHDGTPTEHGFVSHFINTRGAPELVWLDGRNTLPGPNGAGGAMTLRTTTLGDDGRPGDSRVLDPRVCDCCQTAAARTADGPVVVYRDRSADDRRDIAIVRRIDGRWSEPRDVHADGWKIAGCPVNGPAVVASGRFVAAAWFTMAGEVARVRLALSLDAGASFAAPLEFATGTAIGRVDLAATANGVVMTWMERTATAAALRMVRIDRTGRAARPQTLLPLDRGRISGFPRIRARGETLLIAWTATDTDQRPRVRAARLTP